MSGVVSVRREGDVGAGNDSYRRTTQCRHWSYTVEELRGLRKRVYSTSIENLGLGASDSAEDQTAGSPMQVSPQPQRDAHGYPSLEQQQALVLHFTTKLLCACDLFSQKEMFNIKGKGIDKLMPIPYYLEATAITYFKRFFLRNSILENDPADLAQAALFLAAKSEEHMEYDSRQISSMIGGEQNSVRKHEMLLLRGIKFHLCIRHPYNPVAGFCAKLKGFVSGDGTTPLTEEECGILKVYAFNVVRRSLITDACFLWTPAQIAIACIRISSIQVENNTSRKSADILSLVDALLAKQITSLETLVAVNRSIRDCEKLIMKPVRGFLLPKDDLQRLLKQMSAAQKKMRWRKAESQ